MKNVENNFCFFELTRDQIDLSLPSGYILACRGESLNELVPFQLGGDENTTFHVNFQLNNEEKKNLTDDEKIFFKVRKLFNIVPSTFLS